MDEQTTQSGQRRRERSGIIGGVVLIVLGVLFLLDNFVPGFRFHDYWPLLLVALGVGLLWNSRKQS